MSRIFLIVAASLGLLPALASGHTLTGPEVVEAAPDGSFEYEVTVSVDPGGFLIIGRGWSAVENVSDGEHGDCFCQTGCMLEEGDNVFTVSGSLLDPDETGIARFWVASCGGDDLNLFTTIHPATVAVGDAGGRTPVALRSTPNPIVTRATFVTDLARSGSVTLSVYDTQGREVARPFVGTRTEGRLQVTWDAGDADLEPGVYFARLSQEGRPLATCRIVLAR